MKDLNLAKAEILLILTVVTNVHKLPRVAFFAFEEDFLILEKQNYGNLVRFAYSQWCARRVKSRS
jgi:hypothetical protein